MFDSVSGLSQASGAVAARRIHRYRGVDDASNLLNPSEDKFRLDSLSTLMSIPEQSLFLNPTFLEAVSGGQRPKH